jgi:hypothetical protein
MNKHNELPNPTPEQVEQVKKVERALCNEIHLLQREGIPLPILLSGLGMAVADFITCAVGPEAVAPWFASQGAMIAGLQGSQH